MSPRFLAAELRQAGVEVLGKRIEVSLSAGTRLEEFCSIKFAQLEGPVTLGAWSYIVSGFLGNATVGRYCSIGEDVQIGRQSHPLDIVSTSPVFYRDLGEVSNTSASSGYTKSTFRRAGLHAAVRTDIGHDVYIGHGALIMPGVTIGTGAVIGAGSVVTRDVEPFSISAGNPARHIRYRLSLEDRETLLLSKWWRFMPWEFDARLASSPADFVDSLPSQPEYQTSWFEVDGT